MQMKNIETFIPDSVIKINNDNYLIMEFDENDDFHQDSITSEYMTKNLIYDQLLCDEYENGKVNVVILRITYNSTIIRNYKEKAVRILVSVVLFTIYKILDRSFHHQYVLCRINGERKSKTSKVIARDLYVIKPINYEDLKTFSSSSPLFASMDLNKKSILESFKTIRSINQFDTSCIMNEFRDMMFEKYKDSDANKYFNERKDLSLRDNSFNKIIDSFETTTVEDYFHQ